MHCCSCHFTCLYLYSAWAGLLPSNTIWLTVSSAFCASCTNSLFLDFLCFFSAVNPDDSLDLRNNQHTLHIPHEADESSLLSFAFLLLFILIVRSCTAASIRSVSLFKVSLSHPHPALILSHFLCLHEELAMHNIPSSFLLPTIGFFLDLDFLNHCSYLTHQSFLYISISISPPVWLDLSHSSTFFPQLACSSSLSARLLM